MVHYAKRGGGGGGGGGEAWVPDLRAEQISQHLVLGWIETEVFCV